MSLSIRQSATPAMCRATPRRPALSARPLAAAQLTTRPTGVLERACQTTHTHTHTHTHTPQPTKHTHTHTHTHTHRHTHTHIHTQSHTHKVRSQAECEKRGLQKPGWLESHNSVTHTSRFNTGATESQ